MKKIFISCKIKSKNEVEQHDNIKMCKKYCRYVSMLGHLPILPRIYFDQFLNENDENECKIANNIGLEFLLECDEVWFFVNKNFISIDMQEVMKIANENCIAIRYFNDISLENEND